MSVSNQLAALSAMLDECEEWSRQVQQTAMNLRDSIEKAREVERAERSIRWFEAWETLQLLRELYSEARKAGEEELADGIADVLDVLTGWHSMIERHEAAEAAPEMERQPGERVAFRTGPMRRCTKCGAAEDEPHLPGCTGAEAKQ